MLVMELSQIDSLLGIKVLSVNHDDLTRLKNGWRHDNVVLIYSKANMVICSSKELLVCFNGMSGDIIKRTFLDTDTAKRYYTAIHEATKAFNNTAPSMEPLP